MGEKLGHSLYTFHETISNPGKLKQTLTNLARETLINLYKTRIPLIPDQHTITKEYTDNNNNNGISRDFLSPELKINNFHGLKSYSSSPTERLLPWNNQFDKKLLRNSTTILYNKDDDDAINTFETVVKVIRLLEKSIEFKTIQLDEDDENSIHENSSSTSNSNSDSEPEMIFTTENYLNYKFNFRGDYILHNQTEKEINNEINQMNHLTVDKTNEMNKLKKRRRRKTHHHHFHRRRRHHQQQQQKSSFQQNSKNDISYHTPIPLSSSTSSSLAAPSVQQLDHTHTHTHNNNNNKHYQKETGVKINTQNNREMQNRGLYFVSRYAGQSNRGIPCFVEKRLFHRSCQKIRSVWKKIDLTNPQTLHAQQKFVERFTASLETRINQLQKDGTLSIDILKYLKQIHFEAQQQIQFIHNHLQITNRNTYKSLSVSSHGIGLPPPPLPVFTTGYHMKTYSPIIGGGGGGDNKRSYSIGVMNNPQSKSCNLFIRHHKHLIDTTNSLSIIKLPKINDTNTPEN
ncbi:unnamed protein product [Heterobilharzia americana]|nr:unnamed protein product [Heterobilharzia americana]